MANDRDIRRRIPPPPAVRAQIASPDHREPWEDFDSETPVGTENETVQRINTRAKEVLVRTNEVLVSSRNTEERVEKISDGFHVLDHRVGQLAGQVGELHRATGKLEGKLDILTEEIQGDRNERRQLRVAAVTAQLGVDEAAAVARIEIDKTGRIAAIDELKERSAYRRQLVLKGVGAVIGGSAAIWGVISAIAAAFGR